MTRTRSLGTLLLGVTAIVAIAAPSRAQRATATSTADVAPLVIGQTFTVRSRILGEVRRINVYLPPVYSDSAAPRLPVLYMPDGGIAEDFLHVAGLVQVSVGNGTMRPFILVGVENTERRRDMTGPTQVETDKRIAPRVGGSAAFRAFFRDELMPNIRARYRTTEETAIVGESLAGLFIVETFFSEPQLFDTYMAFDPSLWWNNQALVKSAAERLRSMPVQGKTLYVSTGRDSQLVVPMQALAAILTNVPGLRWFYVPMPEETHATIYHPAALRAFRSLFKPSDR